jgi:hypothetical protein
MSLSFLRIMENSFSLWCYTLAESKRVDHACTVCRGVVHVERAFPVPSCYPRAAETLDGRRRVLRLVADAFVQESK